MRNQSFCVILLLIAVSAYSLPVNNSDQALNIAVNELLPQGTDDVTIYIWGPVSAGTEIQGSKEVVAVAHADGYIIYIDDYPTANLFHPVRYAFVNSQTGEVASFNAMSPPANFEDYTQIETVIGQRLNSVQNRRAHIPQIDPPVRSENYAVLMNGGYNSSNNHVRYWNDLSNIYVALYYVYGFADENIIVLCSDGLNPAPDQSNGQNSNPDLDGDGDPDIMYPCVLSTVNAVFDSLAGLLTEDDKLFIFTTDHGSSNGGWNVVENLWNQEELTDAHFAELLAALPQCEIICTFEPCYSGGFLDDVVVPPGPIVASSACAYNQSSWAMSNLIYDEYVFHWTAAVKGEDAFGNPVDADYNGDGIVTMDEAFLYAETHDAQGEDPQYGEYPDGVGSGLSLWPTGPGPFLTVAGTVIDDIGGNNNNAADPGENISILVTLGNYGNDPATNVTGTLSTTDPYLTVTQAFSSFPNIGVFEQGQALSEFEVAISESCPEGHLAECSLLIEADTAYTTDAVIEFLVGDIANNPSGPDSYGYLAYDPYDLPELPVYEWVEICPDSGGLGTRVNFTQDDQVLHYVLPFTFNYYGLEYDSITIATNGWLGMGIITEEDYSNSGIPNADGPACMIATYWEDLSPQRTNSGGVWYWYDDILHRYIVEFNHIEQFAPTGNFETFQTILYDPAYYATVTGDGPIKMQYKDMSSASRDEGTIGIEDHTELIGIQYLFDGTLDIRAHMVDDETCIYYTTVDVAPNIPIVLEPLNPPIIIPANGGNFVFHAEIENAGVQEANFDIWSMVTLPTGNDYGPLIYRPGITLLPGGAIMRDVTQNVPASAPAGNYTYIMYAGNYSLELVYSQNSFGFEKSASESGSGYTDNWDVLGWDEPLNQVSNIPLIFALHPAYPNPFNPETTISFTLNETGLTKLIIFDITGREIVRLADGLMSPGSYEFTFDGNNLASGVYFVRLVSGNYEQAQKLLLLK